MPKSAALVTLALMCTTAAAQTLYKSIGPDGKAVYSDKPPADGRVQKTLKVQDLPNTAIPKATLAELQSLRRQVGTSAVPVASVTLFSATWCGYCKQAKAFLAQQGVAFQELDIDTPAGKLSFAQAGGGTGVPLLIANGTTVQGFSLESYQSLFSKAR